MKTSDMTIALISTQGVVKTAVVFTCGCPFKIGSQHGFHTLNVEYEVDCDRLSLASWEPAVQRALSLPS